VISAAQHQNQIGGHPLHHHGVGAEKDATELLSEVGLELHHFFKIALAWTDAASAMHRREIVHPDLKPDNLIDDEEGWLEILTSVSWTGSKRPLRTD